jgi:DNA-binding transcriptional LysR family regulator
MELRHLRYFIAAAEEEHFGRASDRLHVTRPAVSQIIADLEDELGTPLFERLAHRVKLTAAGRALLPQMQMMMSDLNQSLVMVKRIGEGKTGALQIGYGTLTLLHPLFRAAVKNFHERCPDVTLSLIEIASSAQTKALAEGRIHAGFMHFPPSAGALRKKYGGAPAQDEIVLDRIKIQSGTLGVVVANDHRLARRKSVSLAELAEERFVVIPHSTVSPGYGSLSSLCQKAGFEPRIVQEVGSVTTLLNLVAVGVGIGLTVTGKDFVFPPSLVLLRLNDVNYTTTFALSWVKGRIEPVLERFIETVKELA